MSRSRAFAKVMAGRPGSMARAYIAVGSNILPAESITKALRLLAQRVKVTAISTVYQTRPEGGRVQPARRLCRRNGSPLRSEVAAASPPPYYNCVLAADTETPPNELKRSVLRAVEDQLGRQRGHDKFASRTIDLDLILYGELRLSTDELALPDPEIRERPYLAAGLSELDPGLVMPDTGERIADIAARLGRRDSAMVALPDYTRELRREIANGHG